MQGFSCLYEEVCYYWNGCGIATFRVWMGCLYHSEIDVKLVCGTVIH